MDILKEIGYHDTTIERTDQLFQYFAFHLLKKYNLHKVSLLKLDKGDEPEQFTTGMSLSAKNPEILNCMFSRRADRQTILGNPIPIGIKEPKTIFAESLVPLFGNNKIKGSAFAVFIPLESYDLYFIFTKDETNGKIVEDEKDLLKQYVDHISPPLSKSYNSESYMMNKKRREFRNDLIEKARGAPLEVIAIISQLWQKLLDGSLAKIWLYNELTQEFVLSGMSSTKFPVEYATLKKDCIFGKCAFSNEIQHVAKDEMKDEKQLNLMKSTGADYIICIPLQYKPVGVKDDQILILGFVDVFINSWNISQHGNNDLKRLAHQSASTIQESFLFEKIKILEEFNKIMHNTLGEPQTTVEKRKHNFLKQIIKSLIEPYLSVHAVSIFETTDDELEIVCVATTGIQSDPPLWSVKYKKGEGATGTVFLTGEPKITRDVSKDPIHRHKYKERQNAPDTSYSYIAVPIKAIEKVIGVIRSVNKRGILGGIETFSKRDLDNLVFVSEQLSPVLQMLDVQQKREQGLTIAVHDLKAPLNAIRDASHDLREQIRKEPEIFNKVKYPIDDICNTTSFIHTLIKQVGRAVGEPFVPKLERINLQGEIIARLKAMLFPFAKQKKIGIFFAGFDNLPDVNVDPDLMEQALFNLIVNAIKYSNPHTDINIFSHYNVDKKLYSITIQNEGPGIEEDEKDAIFLPFVRGKAGRNSSPGLGMGLYIVKQIIDAHKGNIYIKNLKNPTEFEIILNI